MTYTGVKIQWKARELEAAHMAEVAALEAMCFSTPWSEQQLADSLASPFFFILGLVNPEPNAPQALAAYISLSIPGDEAEVLNIATRPELRRQGYGRRLLRLALRLAILRGLNRLVLEVRVSNTPARMLYTAEGFHPAGVRRNYYRNNNEDALIMVRKLKD